MSTTVALDTESARAFMEEALAGIADEEIDSICQDVALKSRFFRSKLAPSPAAARESGPPRGPSPPLADEDVRRILRAVFATRRRVDSIMKEYGAEALGSWMRALVRESDPLDTRLQTFDDALSALPESHRYDLATELLHFTYPERYWLWTRWMWDPKTDTGALPLVVSEDFELHADSLPERYRNVGRAVAFVQRVGEAAGFRVAGRGAFATDVYLSFVYVIYVYTVLRMRMTQEFNRVMPELPEFSRRLLGVKQPLDYAC